MSHSDPTRVLLTGATGFVGRHLYPVLKRAGYQVVCTSRDPDRAKEAHPDREFQHLDVADPDSVKAALTGCHAAVYLVHGMADGADYEERERGAAKSFREIAEAVELQRIVYLGGIDPGAKPSKHLRSRLMTGELLRAGRVCTVELQAAMIVGCGSESWRIVRDLSARLPFMVLPSWLVSRSEPVAIDDVCAAITRALALPLDQSTTFALPGPEILSVREILERTAKLCGLRPLMFRVPFVTPRLSTYWIRLVTRADRNITEALVEGLRSDLVASGKTLWEFMPEHERLSFDEAATRALREGDRELPWATRTAERLIRGVALSARP